MALGEPSLPAYPGEVDRVFVLRFWREAVSDKSSEVRWRSRIRFVNTGQQVHVDGIEAAFNLVRSLLIDDAKELR